jgi:hypothetical protein
MEKESTNKKKITKFDINFIINHESSRNNSDSIKTLSNLYPRILDNFSIKTLSNNTNKISKNKSKISVFNEKNIIFFNNILNIWNISENELIELSKNIANINHLDFLNDNYDNSLKILNISIGQEIPKLYLKNKYFSDSIFNKNICKTHKIIYIALIAPNYSLIQYEKIEVELLPIFEKKNCNNHLLSMTKNKQYSKPIEVTTLHPMVIELTPNYQILVPKLRIKCNVLSFHNNNCKFIIKITAHFFNTQEILQWTTEPFSSISK